MKFCSECGTKFENEGKFCAQCGHIRPSQIGEKDNLEPHLIDLSEGICPLIDSAGQFVFSVRAQGIDNVFFQGSSDGAGTIQLELSGPSVTIPSIPPETVELLIDSGWELTDVAENFIFVTEVESLSDCSNVSLFGMLALMMILLQPEESWMTEFTLNLD